MHARASRLCSARRRFRRHVAMALGLVATAACGDDVQSEPAATTGGATSTAGVESGTTMVASTGDLATGSSTAAAPDSGTGRDTGAASTGSTGAASTGSSTGASQSSSGGALDGLGEISGTCGALDAAALESPLPTLVVNTIDFDRVGFDYDLLTPDGQEVFDDGNLGGSSLLSEVIAFEVLARCEGATLTKTEGEIVYADPMGTKTDLLVEMAGHPVGVSVTRAVGFPPEDPYPVRSAATLLTDKLQDVLASTANVAPEDAWIKQVLHVVAYGPMHADSVQEAYDAVPVNLQADTILVVTVTEGDDAFIYD